MALFNLSHSNKTLVLSELPVTVDKLNDIVHHYVGNVEDFYYTHNGKILEPLAVVNDGVIHAIPRLIGGKGGFGSMLRAIGAQIEKTTNREACRDLSGRRLRDINEEKRLKNWIAQQADREREAAEKRKKKLERLCAEPKHEFQDKEYERQRSDLSEKVWDAVDQGMKASPSCSMPSTSQKRKLPEPKKPSKKSCLWVADIDDISSCDSDDSDEDKTPKKPTSSSVKAVTECNSDEKNEKIGFETSDVPADSTSHSEESVEALNNVEGNSEAGEEDKSISDEGKLEKVVETAQESLAV